MKFLVSCGFSGRNLVKPLLAAAVAGMLCSAAVGMKLPTTQPAKPQTKPAAKPSPQPPKPAAPKVSPREAIMLAARIERELLGLFKDKDYAQAADKCAEALALPLPTAMKASFQYNLACARARLGNKAEALAALESAVELGWDDADHMQNDPDLASLRGERQFAGIVRKLSTGVEPHVTRDNGRTVIEGKPGGGLHYRLLLGPGATRQAPSRLIVWLHPSGGLMNNAVEKLAPVLARHGFALMVFTKKNPMGWADSDARKAIRTAQSAGRFDGLDASRPILMGFSAGGQLALMLWAQNPGDFGGVLDAAYPVDLEAYRSGQVKAFAAPKGEGVDRCPLFVVVGTLDGGSKLWQAAEKEWQGSGVPLEIRYVEGGKHAWLLDGDRIKALEAWLDKLPKAARPRTATAPGRN